MKKVNIFVSYSHENSQEFAEVRKTLQSIEGDIGIDVWDDTQLLVGDKWDEKIKESLAKADIGILLVTTPFLTSQYINRKEVKQLLLQYNEGETRIFIVILRHCLWKNKKWLRGFHLLNNGFPLWSNDTTKRDKNLVKLGEELGKVVQLIRKELNKKQKQTIKVPVRKSKIKLVVKQTHKSLIRKNYDLPFTNQIALKNILKPPAKNLNQTTFSYVALSGLARQGKSRLLFELKDIYSRENWNCAYAEFDPRKGSKVLVKELLDDLGISVKEIRSNTNLGSLFYNYYLKKKGWKRPLALFVDTLGTTTQNDIIALDKNFVEDLSQWITANKYYSIPGRFRLILAGRNLSGDLIYSQKPDKYTNLKLSPFRYEDVRDMLDEHKHFSNLNLNPDILSDFAADLLYLSGGHPGLMSKIVEEFIVEEKSPKNFFDYYINNVWEKDLSDTMDDVSQGLFHENQGIKDLAEKTVAFRFFNRSIIGKLYKGKSPEWIASEVINPSGLYRDDNPHYPNLYSDGILRDLHSMYVLSNNPERIRAKCEEARSLCWDEIVSSINAREFMIEYLFQCLQESIAESKIKIHSQRNKIRRSFEKKMKEFFVKLSKIHNTKSRKNDYPRQLIKDLRSHADIDDLDKNKALFRFWIIYLYKDKFYNNDVYNNFTSFAERLVKNHFTRS